MNSTCAPLTSALNIRAKNANFFPAVKCEGVRLVPSSSIPVGRLMIIHSVLHSRVVNPLSVNLLLWVMVLRMTFNFVVHCSCGDPGLASCDEFVIHLRGIICPNRFPHNKLVFGSLRRSFPSPDFATQALSAFELIIRICSSACQHPGRCLFRLVFPFFVHLIQWSSHICVLDVCTPAQIVTLQPRHAQKDKMATKGGRTYERKAYTSENEEIEISDDEIEEIIDWSTDWIDQNRLNLIERGRFFARRVTSDKPGEKTKRATKRTQTVWRLNWAAHVSTPETTKEWLRPSSKRADVQVWAYRRRREGGKPEAK